MSNLLNEEIERMQVLAGVKTSNETFESVLKEFIDVIDDYEYSLMEETLNEGLWEKAKYYLGKLGRYKVNGKFWGKNKELEASRKRIDDLLAKEANSKIKELIQNIKKYNPEFPNNESADSFLDTCLHIGKLYDSIIAATKKDPNDGDFMPIDMANEIINDLREYVKHTLDAELKSSYTTFNEAEEDKSIGDIENYDRRAKKDLLKRRAGKDEFTSERMKTLKSWRLPLSLFGVGGALGGLSWLLDLLQNKADLIHVLKGEGMTQILNRAGDRGGWGLPKLGPDSPLSDVQKYISKVGEGDYKLGLDRLTADNGMFQDPEAAREALVQMGSADQNTTAGDFFKNKLAGTGKMPGDMLVTKALGPLLLKQGARAVAPWLGKFASGLGVALIAGSVAVALARLKGKKSSRAATLNYLYQSLKNIQPTEENPTVVPVENTPGGEDQFKPTDGNKNQSKDQAEENPKGQDLAQNAIQSKSRDQEIVALLKIANPNLEFNAQTKPIIQNIRRNPNELIKKLSSVLGLDLGVRQKSTGAFKRSGVAENLMFEDLMLEAAIDNNLAKLGITDDAIKANKDAIATLIKDMYKLGGGTQLGGPKEKTPVDVQTITKDIELNSTLKNVLSRINTYDEFEALVLGMAGMVNPNFAKQKQDIKAALFSLSNKIKAMKEESETPTDTQSVYKVIEALSSLKTHLNNINNKDEFEKLIFALLPFIDPKGTITKDKNKIANAIISASNRSSLKDTKPVDLDQLGR